MGRKFLTQFTHITRWHFIFLCFFAGNMIEVNAQNKGPVCKKIEKELSIHGDVRIDPYYWLNDREDPEVIAYLNAENEYTHSVMHKTEPFQKKLYDEIVNRIKKDDETVPYLLNGYWYYVRYVEGGEYPLYCRRKGNLEAEEEIMLNVNEMAEGHAYYQVGGVSVSPDSKTIAFGVDNVSRRIYTIYFKDLVNNKILDISIPNTTGSASWANDNNTLFYSVRNEQTLRSEWIMKYSMAHDKSEEVYFEKDETFTTFVYKSKSKKYIIIASSSTLTNEYMYLDAGDPDGEFKVFQERVRGIEYGIAHAEDRWYVLTNWDAINFRLMECEEGATGKDNWKEVIAHREDVLLEGIDAFRDYLVLSERSNGLTHLRIMPSNGAKDHYMEVDEAAYSLWSDNNPEFDTEWFRVGYTSLITPSSIFDYNMNTRERVLKKEQEVVGGYDKSAYRTERTFVTVRDGANVPVSIVYKGELTRDGKRPLLLYGYGSYGNSIDVYFSHSRLSLLDRGFVYVIAHIRGGEEMGRHWYDDGKLLKKKNTFYDFIDCGKYLIEEGYTSTPHLYAMGGSAGGLLMGAVINLEPDMWNGVVAAVPFVDVVSTMLDETIPLTTGEYDEWGNPNDETYYKYIKSYSPYDNIEAKNYPNLLVTTGLHDSQVQYWEPAKWVARLREFKTDNNLLLLKTEMEQGHGGASGRFQRFKDVAFEYAFLLSLENIKE